MCTDSTYYSCSMPVDHVYFEDDNIVLTQIYGKLTPIELLGHVETMGELCSHNEAVIELVDCRLCSDTTEMTGASLMSVASLEQGQPWADGSKCAIVVDTELHYGLARIYATIASETRMQANVFYSLDEAINWLGIEQYKLDIEACHEKIKAGLIRSSCRSPSAA